MRKVTITSGIPASGKTTWAKEQQKKDPNIIRVNKDSLREMLNDGRYSKTNEKFVLKVRDFIISEAVNNGNNVIVDDTNLSSKHKDRITQLVKGSAIIKTKNFDISLEECVERDLHRKNSVGEKVIKDMYNQFVKKQETIEKIDGLPEAIIIDIDGTLAHMDNKRGPYEYDKAIDDRLDKNVERILNFYRDDGYIIIILSGRDSKCRAVTEEWLYKNNIKYDYLYMRKHGDERRDAIAKRELFDEHIRGKYNIDIIFDDRDQMIDCWREMGLVCYQVADGNF